MNGCECCSTRKESAGIRQYELLPRVWIFLCGFCAACTALDEFFWELRK